MSSQLIELPTVKAMKEHNGVEMGVLEDGTAFLTGRSLARFCGVDPVTIHRLKEDWLAGKRGGQLARHLVVNGIDQPTLAFPIRYCGAGIGSESLAYPEPVVIAVADYYAYEVGKREAINNLRALARYGFQRYVYEKTGYKPNSIKNESSSVENESRSRSLENFHIRLLRNDGGVPPGYFCVFHEIADLYLTAIRLGLSIDDMTVPDISVASYWTKYWEKHDFDVWYGSRIRYAHYYPEHYRQAKSNPQSVFAYPAQGLGDFRFFMQTEYVPKHFFKYLKSKVKDCRISQADADLLLAKAAEVKSLPEPPRVKGLFHFSPRELEQLSVH